MDPSQDATVAERINGRFDSLIAAVQTATWKETKQRMKTLEELCDQTKMFRKFV